MIKVFGGEWRGLGKKEKHQGMILEFEFRKYLKEFKGARLAVFMCIALHCNENGECFPSYDLIEDETGLTRGTVATAINDLCELVIEGHRVLHRFRERDTAGKYIGSNHYLVFPTDEEVQSIENQTVDNQSIKKPQYEKPNGGEIIPEVNPSLKVNPSKRSSSKATRGEPEQPPTPVEEPLPPRPDIYTLYEQELGALTPMLAQMLDLIERDYPQGWFKDAVKEAKLSSSRGVSLKYVDAILKRWKSEGRTVNNVRKAPEPVYAERW
jgi:DnaD/phage-associated family protein